MAEIINLDDYRTVCQDCIYHTEKDGLGICTYRSLVHHFECGAWMYRTECIPNMKSDFLRTLEKSEEITPESAKLRWWERIVAEPMKVFSALL